MRMEHVCRSCHTDVFKIQNSPRALEQKEAEQRSSPAWTRGVLPTHGAGLVDALPGTA